MYKIRDGANLRSGVTFEGEFDLLRRDAAPVVGHPNKAHAAVLDFDRHARGPSIDRVIQQLPHDRHGTFDNLAGCDAGGDFRRENVDGGHAFECKGSRLLWAAQAGTW